MGYHHIRRLVKKGKDISQYQVQNEDVTLEIV